MLQLVNPPAYRHCIAKEWMRYNYGMIYVQNTMSRVLGTAHQLDVELLSWELLRPKAVKAQVVEKKRRL
jgi:hypothetical protein